MLRPKVLEIASGNNQPPTNGYAKITVVSTDSFTKSMTFQKISEKEFKILVTPLKSWQRLKGYKHTKCSYITIKSD
jgi:histidinol dehydrogenase